jgi:hypothetical protein
MNYLTNFWSKFKTQPDIWFFYAFLLTFTFSVRKIVNYFPIQGTKERTFNEYSAIFIYISDIFLFFTILSWSIYLLSNKLLLLSTTRLWITSFLHRLYNKILLESKFLFYNSFKCNPGLTNSEDLTNIPFRRTDCSTTAPWNVSHGTFIFIPLFLVIWSFISIFWSQNQNIAFFRSIKLFEYYLLYLYIVFRIIPYKAKSCSAPAPSHPNVPHGTFGCFTGWNNIMIIIIFIGVFQSIISIIQFAIQHSIGIFWLKESLISPNIVGVAKLVINGHIYIRSYGLFPHPNVLAGFLLFSIIITLLYKRMFHPAKVIDVPRGTSMTNGAGVEHSLQAGTFLTNTADVKHIEGLRTTTVINIFIAIQSLALLLTFSKSAIVGLAISLFYIYIVPHGTSLSNIKQGRNLKIVLLTFSIVILIIYLLWPILGSILYNSLQQRMLYLDVSRGTIMDNPLIGVGVGQFVLDMSRYAKNLESWQFQPVHNVFLLIWSELGIVGLFLFIYWLYKSILQNKYYYLSSTVALHYFKATLLGFIFIMLFDHYFWDIQQGSVLLWITLGFIAGARRK